MLDNIDALQRENAELQAKLAPGPCPQKHPAMFWHVVTEDVHFPQDPPGTIRFKSSGPICDLCLALSRVADDATVAEHSNHVQFAADMYSILVDPCADGSIKEAEMFETLKRAATEQRETIYRHAEELKRAADTGRATGLSDAAEHMCLFIDEDWTVKCSCGWSKKCNEREYTNLFAGHIRALDPSAAKALEETHPREDIISESTVTNGMVEIGGRRIAAPGFPEGQKVEVVARERRERQGR